jgi:prolyl 4-hydroxylase
LSQSASIDDAIEKRAAAGDIAAQIACGSHCERLARHDAARQWFKRAAEAGNVAALRSLAINLMSYPPTAMRDGFRMMRSAAARGDATAASLCAVVTAQDPNAFDNWDVALVFLMQAAELGSAAARRQLEILALGRGDVEEIRNDARASDPKTLAQSVEMASWLNPGTLAPVSDDPLIFAMPDFAPHAVCDWMIERAKPRLARAETYDPASGLGREESGVRSNSVAKTGLADFDVLLVSLQTRIGKIPGIAPALFEPPSFLHYAIGENFLPHVDYLDPAIPGFQRDIAQRGQRIATFLLYLNDDYEGGETEFCELGIRHRGKKGDGLLFWNVDRDGRPNPKTLHAGVEPTSGEKWVLSQWIRRPAIS